MAISLGSLVLFSQDLDDSVQTCSTTQTVGFATRPAFELTVFTTVCFFFEDNNKKSGQIERRSHTQKKNVHKRKRRNYWKKLSKKSTPKRNNTPKENGISQRISVKT
uniref:Uncharacterized protein n=1 Tax=Cacopsylla melanoneura TaxID=428564 RepID=A0A8D9APM0_9HEMI